MFSKFMKKAQQFLRKAEHVISQMLLLVRTVNKVLAENEHAKLAPSV